MKKIPSSEITPEHVYFSRRRFLREGMLLAGAALLAACAPRALQAGSPADATPTLLPDRPNTYEEITNYNNFYEFSFSKEAVARLSAGLVTSPWEVRVEGLVRNPGVYDLDQIRKQFDQEERIYRLRCVEGWSMVIPWVGFPLHKLLKAVEPTSDARYVQFTTLYDPQQMPGQNNKMFEWPYVEGLRMDEAMHDLTLLATGIYGKDLLPQNGAPVRLVVPWKYGFKSIKSIVKIELTAEMPPTFWSEASPDEYGFYANVNPEVPHPRWSQASERRIGESGRRPTLKFNGYEEVSSLYEGMDLRRNY
ncbi:MULTISPECIES: protein-methionine-sulfoxide reductase catalytic subunit MsrP [Anaerolinea]|uniref:protein-methionine-sulfoxide reductase catalytic subunit MsrP n=1 Tax=Anaerolinea TaxID=233189 RepID=UPI002603E872|nr:protein-methionine-sulfoxide reductase catalytic subunit MsrP [Anaerolinea thermophila]